MKNNKSLSQLKEDNKILSEMLDRLTTGNRNKLVNLLIDESTIHLHYLSKKAKQIKSEDNLIWLKKYIKFWREFLFEELGYIPQLDDEEIGNANKLVKEKKTDKPKLNRKSTEIGFFESLFQGSFRKIRKGLYPNTSDPELAKMLKDIRN